MDGSMRVLRVCSSKRKARDAASASDTGGTANRFCEKTSRQAGVVDRPSWEVFTKLTGNRKDRQWWYDAKVVVDGCAH